MPDNTSHLEQAPLVWAIYATSIAGAVSSAWMLVACSRGPVSLLKRQLFHQAVSTLLLNIFKSGLMILALIEGDANCLGDTSNEDIMHPVVMVMHGLFFVSCFADLHIAASLAAASSRAPQALRWLEWCLPAVWPLSVVYTVAWAFTTESVHHSNFGPSIILVSFVLTFVFYVAAIRASNRHHAPDVASRRIRRRAMVYPLLFMLIGLPTCARYFGYFPACSMLGRWSFLLDHAEGVLNSLAYCILSGAPQKPSASREVELGGLGGKKAPRSLKVIGFSEKVEAAEAVAGGSWRLGGQWMASDAGLDDEVARVRSESGLEGGQGEGESEALWRQYVGG